MEETLGQRVKRLRNNKKWTSDELSTRSGVSKQYISNIEKDMRSQSPSAYKIHELASALGVTVEYLLTGKEVNIVENDPLANLDPELREIHKELFNNKGNTSTYFRKQAKELDHEGLTSILEFIRFCKHRARVKDMEEGEES